MKRFSISFTDREYKLLVEMMELWELRTGVTQTRCAMIKRILFALERQEPSPHAV
jgi:hypothetical protein